MQTWRIFRDRGRFIKPHEFAAWDLGLPWPDRYVRAGQKGLKATDPASGNLGPDNPELHVFNKSTLSLAVNGNMQRYSIQTTVNLYLFNYSKWKALEHYLGLACNYTLGTVKMHDDIYRSFHHALVKQPYTY